MGLLSLYMPLTKEKMNELETRVETFFKDNKIPLERKLDITKVCTSLGITVSSLKLPDELKNQIDGLILVKEGSKKIGINSELSPQKARFVIAHELSHYITQGDSLEYAFKDEIYHGKEKSQLEQYMDYMAAAILVPRKIFKVYLDVLSIEGEYNKETVLEVNPVLIDLLADRFQVEKDVIYRRIIEVA